MASFHHKALFDRIMSLNEPPTDEDAYARWITGEDHLQLLREDAESDELLVHVGSQHVFVYAVVVPEQELRSVPSRALLDWDGDPYSARIGYAWGGGDPHTRLETLSSPWRSGVLPGTRPLIHLRDLFAKPRGREQHLELCQEYAHLTGMPCASPQGFLLHDENGDIVDVVSVTSAEDPPVWSVVSFLRYPLEQYLAASKSVLVRMFDFNLYDPKTFSGWPQHEANVVEDSRTIFHRFEIPGFAGYLRGVQPIPLGRSRNQILDSINKGPLPRRTGFVSFLAHDWRNRRVVEVSVDPDATTNYVEKRIGLPFEMSPAFFRPEVMRKYESDSGKYKIGGREISCADRWRLQAIGRNAANQVHAYIRYLRNLPYGEQLHWKAHNEPPKAPISADVMRMDFEGEWNDLPSQTTAVSPVLRRLREWKENDVEWWKCRDDEGFSRIRTMFTESQEEWRDKCRELATLAIEGFDQKWLRRRAEAAGETPDQAEKSLRLLERILRREEPEEPETRLEALRELQWVRTLGSHARGSDARRFLAKIEERDGTYRTHFEQLCERIDRELNMIEEALRPQAGVLAR
ncbi:MAG: hypothetical protein OXE58_13595 [Acidobacteria bacterium]|nr:hypothetical protein [Acidobacteriota bacterium]